MASRTIITEILERVAPYLGRRPLADELGSVVDDFVREFRGTDAELLDRAVSQWLRNQPTDRAPQTLPRPAQIWPLLNRDRTEAIRAPENRVARFVRMPAHVKEQLEALRVRQSIDATPAVRAAAVDLIRALAQEVDLEAMSNTRACRCIGGWIYEGGQAFPVEGLLCERRVYPCKTHNPTAFETWLADERVSS